MSRVVIFPIGKQTQATAYADAVNAHYSSNIEVGGVFTLPPRNDGYGQWGVAYYGDAVNGVTFNEPAELIPARADGVLHAFAIWPVED